MSSIIGNATSSDNHLTSGRPALAVQAADRDPFCPECGQPLPGRASGLTREAAPYPWWAWVLIALGVGLAAVYGVTAGQAARELAVTGQTLQTLPAWETHGEGPSVQEAMLRGQAPAGIEDRYLAAEHDLNRTLPSAEFGLALAVLGGSVLARRSSRGTKLGSSLGTEVSKSRSRLVPILGAFVGGWALTETVALSACCLIGVGYLYLLGVQVIAGEAPTGEVLQDTFERLIVIVGKMPGLLG